MCTVTFFFFCYKVVVWKCKYWKWAHPQKIQNRTFPGNNVFAI